MDSRQATQLDVNYLLQKLDDSVQKISDAAQNLSVSVALQAQKISELQTTLEVLIQTRVVKLENDLKKIGNIMTLMFGGFLGALFLASVDHGKFFDLIGKLLGF
jgi:hypothetical protein